MPPNGITREYTRAILALIAEVEKELEPLLAELPTLTAQAVGERADIGEGARVADLVDEARERLTKGFQRKRLSDIAEKFAVRTKTHQRIQLNKQLHAAIGVDLFLPDTGMAAIVDGCVAENVALIKDVPNKLIGDIERTINRGMQGGVPHPQLAKQLEKQFGFARKRAKLIARDQIGKMYGQINATRQKAIGVEKFIWRTVQDDRVRDEHEALEDKEFKYSDPPSEGLPGEPINCRCYPEPVLDDILEGTQ